MLPEEQINEKASSLFYKIQCYFGELDSIVNFNI